ncbi:hypothetical protein AAAC51_06390 [Priestia megaterium]
MSYELVVVPMDYTKHLKEKDSQMMKHSCCVMCDEELELIDEFINTNAITHNKTEFEGIFSLCPSCKTAHLELVSATVSFGGPVLIGWE